ncbi:Peroxidase [Bertholletia excelsa]
MALSVTTVFLKLFVTSLLVFSAQAQLSPNFYDITVNKEPRMAASILCLFFHDCFVNGCDASILLDDTATFTREKNAFANRNSARGFEVIDTIKTQVEAVWNNTVSCADILALAARDGVVLPNGPTWNVRLGPNSQIPSPFASLSTLISMFSAKGLTARDMTALSGARTIGLARFSTFCTRIYNETNINAAFAATLQNTGPATGGDTNLAPLDIQTLHWFDNHYYGDLVAQRGLLHSDQELFNGGSQDALVRTYSANNALFARDFAAAMVKMGNISPFTRTSGEIRKNCRVVN